MRYCKNSSECCWGSISTPNTCAYYSDKTDYDCPMIWENYEVNLDKYYGDSDKKSTERDPRPT